MFSELRIFLFLAVFLSASVVSAKDQGPPNIDIQKECRIAQSFTDAMFGRNITDILESCVKTERGAHDQLVREWAIIPASDKVSCVHPGVYAPSYVEWMSCIESARNMRKKRKEYPIAVISRNLCPLVAWQEDGSIASAIACGSMHTQKRLY